MALINPPKPDTKEHGDLAQKVMDAVEASYQARLPKEKDWRVAEEQMWLVQKTAKEVAAQVREDKKPQKTENIGGRIQIPVFYALNWAQLSSMYGTIAKRDPLFPLMAMSPDDTDPALLLESLVMFQANQRKWNIKAFQSMYSGFTYGVGFKKHYWLEKKEVALDAVERQVVKDGVPQFEEDGSEKLETVITENDSVVYSGNEWEYISPWDFFFDTSFPARDFQDGQFVCHRTMENEDDMMEKERNGEYQNVKAAIEGKFDADTYPVEGQNKVFKSQLDDPQTLWTYKKPQTHYIFEFIGKIIPKDYKLSGSSSPQKWLIVVCNGIVLKTEPWTYKHNRYPYSCWEPHPVIQIPYGPSYNDLQSGLGKWINWSMNFRRDSGLRGLNSWLLIDSASVEDLSAFQSNEPMKVIPMRVGSGKSMQDLAHEIRFNDASGTAVTDANMAWDILQRMFALSENSQGQYFKGRRTAKETASEFARRTRQSPGGRATG